MTIGTKSVIYGAHCFLIHPWFVWVAWCKLYGFTLDIRILTACVVHDLGYWGKPNMDGPEGETHVEFGAAIMHRLFDRHGSTEWRDFSLYHSRFYAKRDDQPFSRLCVADKLSVALEPWWLYLPRVMLSGEIVEYMALAKSRTAQGEPKLRDPKYASMNLHLESPRVWFADMTNYLRAWVREHQDGREDTWTPTPQRDAK